VRVILKMKICLLFVFLGLSGCSLLGTSQWTAYRVTVNVVDELGVAVEFAKLESNGVQTKETNELGRVVIQFRAAGLHVVTLTAENKATKQIKVSLPKDDGKVLNATLVDKRIK